MGRWSGALAGAVVVVFAAPVRAQEPSPSPAATARPAPARDAGKAFDDMSLEELLDVPIGVATKRGTSARESPGIVTLVTREEIQAIGARDLIDVLSLVPGFTFALDVGGIVDIGFRGNWAHEGKALLLFDGIMMNELLYSSLQFGNHYPVDEIERIEIIRGPGSAVYGGYAELAVINVVTRRGSEIHGVRVSSIVSRIDGAFSATNISAAAGTKLANGLEMSASGTYGDGRRGSGTFTDFNGTSIPMTNETLAPRFLDAGASWHGVALRVLLDDYYTRTQDGYSQATAYALKQRFDAYDADLLWEAKLGDHLTITPRFTILHQVPWRTTSADPAGAYYDKTVERLAPGVSAAWNAAEGLDVSAGLEAYQDTAWLNGPQGIGFQTPFNADGAPSIQYRNGAAYTQVLWRNPIADLALGARFERHSHFGNSFVPRAALTKVIDRFHMKLLYSESFRAPGIENIAINPGIKPERTREFEAEVGYRLGENVFLAANAFDSTIRNPIVYAVLGTTQQGYYNFSKTGTRGAELDVRAKFPGGFLDVNGSFATPAGKNKVDLYAVPGNDQYLLGFPQWKIALGSGLNLAKGITAGPSVVVLGPRYGYLTADGSGTSTGVIGREDLSVVLNLFLNTKSVILEGLDLGAGVYDITDANPSFLQPYNGSHAPLPGPGRSFVARASYEF